MTGAAGAPSPIRVECRAFCRYLSGTEPSDYVTGCYESAWQSAEAAATPEYQLPLIDRSLLGWARSGALPARIADSYARLFRPSAPLRCRLILLLAILENSPPTAERLNSAAQGAPLAVGARVAGTLLASALCVIGGVVLLGPVHLLSALRGRRR